MVRSSDSSSSVKGEKIKAGRSIRTQVGTSCLLDKSVKVEKIKAGRSVPGLRYGLVVNSISQLKLKR